MYRLIFLLFILSGCTTAMEQAKNRCIGERVQTLYSSVDQCVIAETQKIKEEDRRNMAAAFLQGSQTMAINQMQQQRYWQQRQPITCYNFGSVIQCD